MLACVSPEFWRSLGHEIDPACLVDPSSALVFSAIRAMVSEGAPLPKKPTPVVQRLSRWAGEGKLQEAQFQDARGLAMASVDSQTNIDQEGLISEVASTVRSHLMHEALSHGVQEHSKTGVVSNRLSEMLDRARALGKTSVSESSIIGNLVQTEKSLRAMAEHRSMQRLPFGIACLDDFLGGYPIPSFGTVLGPPGGGKSMCLNQLGIAASCAGYNVGYASLEIFQEEQTARSLGGFTDTPYRLLADGDVKAEARALEALAEVRAKYPMGVFVICYFSPQVTTVDSLVSWLDDQERKLGDKIHILIVDYISHLDDPAFKAGHEKLNSISLRLRTLGKQRGMGVLTASQAKASSLDRSKTKKLDLYDMGESLGPAKVADFVLSFVYDEETEEIYFYVPKNRHGPSKKPPVKSLADFDYGRITAMDWQSIWDFRRKP
jgi:KaiC/GvpD/RAD55 family RecA-like ATPase